MIVATTLLSNGCETDRFILPNVDVDLHLNIVSELGNPALFSSTLVDGGVNGLIVYREDYNIFHVYDRTCAMFPEHNAAVVEDSSFSGVFTCPECGSKYLLTNPGYPLEGPAAYFLHEYYSVVEGDLLHVYN